jgi:SAM-dependent methyltransferase
MPINPETPVRPDVATMQMEQQLEQVRQAYDLTVEQHSSGTDWLAQVPEAFKNSSELQALMQEPCNSGVPENRQYLDPQPGMHFLDVGCCANLANHRLGQWPSTYYGVDISPALVEAMQGFAVSHQILIGGLHVAEIGDLPFEADFFDIADVIGVLEYCTLDYTERALIELNRVLKSSARMVVDIPNLAHPLAETMFQLEDFLGRPNVPKPQAAFEQLLTPLFAIDHTDESHVMLKYFVRAIKGKNQCP